MTAKKSIPRITGVSVPLAALRTKMSAGIGEYPDLGVFAEFCEKAGISLIQILPVNDTATDSSPYNAKTAFALHPVYLSIESVSEYKTAKKNADKIGKILSELKSTFESKKRFDYMAVREKKLEALRLIFDEHYEKLEQSAELKAFLKEQKWAAPYAVYMRIKRNHMEASWKEWEKDEQDLGCDPKKLQKAFDEIQHKSDHLFYVWLQLQCDIQFKSACGKAAALGLIVKGDIPIMINEDSCDAWTDRKYFNHAMRAGAPPDPFNASGQAWGFPCYAWDALKKDGYSWWKARLEFASRYYKAFRIDHVLGFFRIWQSSEHDFTAYLGRPEPLIPITKKELLKAGFGEARIRWLSKPHIPTWALQNALNNDYNYAVSILINFCDRLGNEELWLFKNTVRGEKDIAAANIPESAKKVLLEYWHNIALIETETDGYFPIWTFKKSTAWESLSEEEKRVLLEIIEKQEKKHQKLWEDHAREILGELVHSTKMIACGEDLGAAPEALPKVLEDLNVLCLRVVRWTRAFEKEGEPFVPFEKYPELSVITLGVHDSSTTRQWWENEGDQESFKNAFFGTKTKKTAAATPPPPPEPYTPEIAEKLMTLAAGAPSAFCIHPVQDLLSLDKIYYDADSKNERINEPGTLNDFNWTYRLPKTIEEIAANKTLMEKIKRVAKR